jgi:hypothetical protein
MYTITPRGTAIMKKLLQLPDGSAPVAAGGAPAPPSPYIVSPRVEVENVAQSYGAPPPPSAAALPVPYVIAPRAGAAAPLPVAPDPLNLAAAEVARIEQSPVKDKNGRLRSFGIGLMRALSPGMAQAQTSAAARGQVMGWGDLATGLAHAGGSGAAGAITPTLDERQDKKVALEQARGRQAYVIQARKAAGDIAKTEADVARTKAETEALSRPKEYKPVYRKQAGITYRIEKDGTATPVVGKDGQPLASDYRPPTIDQLGEDGVTLTKLQLNPHTMSYEAIMVNGLPVVARRVQRVNVESGMTEAGERSDTDRDAARTEAIRRTRANESLGRERFTEQRRHNQVTEARTTQGGTRGGVNADTRRNRAESAITKLDNIITKARTTKLSSKRDALIRQAQAAGNLIRAQYGDIVDDGDEGLPTRLKPRATSSATTTGGARYAGQRFSLSNLSAIRQRLGVSSDEEARRIIEANGGKVID